EEVPRINHVNTRRPRRLKEPILHLESQEGVRGDNRDDDPVLIPPPAEPVVENLRMTGEFLRVILEVEIRVFRLEEDDRSPPCPTEDDESVGTVIPIPGEIGRPGAARLPPREATTELPHRLFR